MRLKILPLDSWMKVWHMRDEEGELNYEIEILNDHTDAKYMHGDVSWFVVDGMAYKYDAKMFKYELRLANATMYRESEYEALCHLRANKVLNKEQTEH
jgi:hypothetical protein